MATTYDVGRVEDLPSGTSTIVTVRGIEIGIFNVAGTYYALPNLCIHQWGPLCAGKVSGTLAASAERDWQYEWVREGEIVICPWHALEFDITSGQCLAYPRVKLRRYPVAVEDGIVRVVV
ncbi:MAG: Rieske (2Fe-2S) protein [Chloroflexi bacterium]|nr:Rieske (2Fe-2S) protein [Chloroflexota bacterium]